MTPGLLLFALVDAMFEVHWWRATSLHDYAEARSRLGQWRALWWG